MSDTARTENLRGRDGVGGELLPEILQGRTELIGDRLGRYAHDVGDLGVELQRRNAIHLCVQLGHQSADPAAHDDSDQRAQQRVGDAVEQADLARAGDEVLEDFGVGGRLEQRAFRRQLAAQVFLGLAENAHAVPDFGVDQQPQAVAVIGAPGRVLIHQPLISGRMVAPAVDINIQAKEMERLRVETNKILAEASGQPLERIVDDTRRNFWLDAESALEYGLVGRIVAAECRIAMPQHHTDG